MGQSIPYSWLHDQTRLVTSSSGPVYQPLSCQRVNDGIPQFEDQSAHLIVTDYKMSFAGSFAIFSKILWSGE